MMGDLTTNFSRSEFMCPCGCRSAGVKSSLVGRLQAARDEAGIPFKISSGVRCREHNRQIGGVDSSAHVKGHAADIDNADTSQERFAILHALLKAGFTRIGIAKTFIHVDDDPDKPAGVVWLY